jgi:ATP-dependent Clp protease ATP-binding subunit ClpC
LPIHRITQTPWCVVLFANLHACHPQVRSVISNGLRDGFITDGRGKRIYLSDTIVLLTARLESEGTRSIGFRAGEASGSDALRETTARQLDRELVALVDEVALARRPSTTHLRDWLRHTVLAELSKQYQGKGLRLEWSDTLVEWLLTHEPRCRTRADWERLLESQVLSELVDQASYTDGGPMVVRVEWSGEQVRVETVTTP